MDNQKIKKAMQQAEASLELEGMKLTEVQRQLVYSVLTGKITEEEFHKKVLELIQREK